MGWEGCQFGHEEGLHIVGAFQRISSKLRNGTLGRRPHSDMVRPTNISRNGKLRISVTTHTVHHACVFSVENKKTAEDTCTCGMCVGITRRSEQ